MTRQLVVLSKFAGDTGRHARTTREQARVGATASSRSAQPHLPSRMLSPALLSHRTLPLCFREDTRELHCQESSIFSTGAATGRAPSTRIVAESVYADASDDIQSKGNALGWYGASRLSEDQSWACVGCVGDSSEIKRSSEGVSAER